MLPVRLTAKQRAVWIAWGRRLCYFSLGYIIAGGKEAVVALAVGAAILYIGHSAIVVDDKPKESAE